MIIESNEDGSSSPCELSPSPASKTLRSNAIESVPVLEFDCTSFLTRHFCSKPRLRSSRTRDGAFRKPTALRSTRKWTRSLSERRNHGNVVDMRQDKDTCVSAWPGHVVDMFRKPALRLPHFSPSEPVSFPRIANSTLLALLQGAYDHVYDEKIIIDCRFEYEYEGGHIKGALNYWDKEKLAERLFRNSSPSNSTLIVLHCEYSAHRAPLM